MPPEPACFAEYPASLVAHQIVLQQKQVMSSSNLIGVPPAGWCDHVSLFYTHFMYTLFHVTLVTWLQILLVQKMTNTTFRLEGLWVEGSALQRDLAVITQRIRLLGFNAIRLPFSFQDLFNLAPR